MDASITLTASLEDYLEAISHIVTDKQVARSKDIARRLKVSYASVTGALRSLAEKGLINYNPYDVVTLTQQGKTAAADIIHRHETLRDFFIHVLAVDEKEADEAACKMEHSIPNVILERFIQFAQFVEVCPRGGSKWIAGFRYQCDHDGTQENCEKCIAEVLDTVRTQKQLRGQKHVMAKKLRELQPGGKGKVIKMLSRGEVHKRIVEMGVTPGSVVEVERVAPLGDPIDIKVKGYHLSLRKEEAEGIEVEPL